MRNVNAHLPRVFSVDENNTLEQLTQNLNDGDIITHGNKTYIHSKGLYHDLGELLGTKDVMKVSILSKLGGGSFANGEYIPINIEVYYTRLNQHTFDFKLKIHGYNDKNKTYSNLDNHAPALMFRPQILNMGDVQDEHAREILNQLVTYLSNTEISIESRTKTFNNGNHINLLFDRGGAWFVRGDVQSGDEFDAEFAVIISTNRYEVVIDRRS